MTVLGFTCSPDPAESYGTATTAAVAAFQAERGLRTDGRCGHETWSLLVEAGYRLGDRRLYQRKPMMRGDDVADLQRRLGAMGFDAGKVDGIYGPDTAGAVADFQRNVGLTVDAIFGPDELLALERVGPAGQSPVAELRELATLRWSVRTLDQQRIVVAERGGLDALATAIGRRLGRLGAGALVLHHPDASELAGQANAAAADVFVEVCVLPEGTGCRCAYYHTTGYTSPAGQRLAEVLCAKLAARLAIPSLGTVGMAIPVLRETRMPAVTCEIGPASLLVEQAAPVAECISDAVVTWTRPP